MDKISLLCRGRMKFKDFLLSYYRPEDFVHCSAFRGPMPYAVFITCVALYTVIMVVYSGVYSGYKEKIFIWLTYWSFYALTTRFVLTAINVWRFIYCQRSQLQPRQQSVKEICVDFPARNMPRLYKAQWLLQNISSCSALIVTGLYWTVMHVAGKAEGFASINSHVINSILALTDLLFSRVPVRIHHFIFTSVFFLIYAVFSVLYWAAGGTNNKGEPYIYALLNYSSVPGRAVGVVLGVIFLAVPFLQTFLYGLYRLRMWTLNKLQDKNHKDKSLVSGLEEVTLKCQKYGAGTRVEEENCLGQKVIDNADPEVGHEKENSFFLNENSPVADNEYPHLEEFRASSLEYIDAVDEKERVYSRPPLVHSNISEVSCTDSTKGLLT